MGHRGAVSCPWSSASTRSHPLLPGERRWWPPSTRGAGRAAAESRGAELGCARERGNRHRAVPGRVQGSLCPGGWLCSVPCHRRGSWGCWPLGSTWDCLLRCWGLEVGRLREGWGARSPAGSRRCQESGAGAGVGQGPVGFTAPGSFRLLCHCRAGSAWGGSGVWVMLVQQHTPAASLAPGHCSAESSSALLWDMDMAAPRSEHFWAKVGEPACQCSQGRGAALGGGTGWGPLETQCGPLALALVVCSPSRRPQHQPQCSVATAVVRMRPGAGRVPARPGAWQDGEAATSAAGRGCFIGESAGGCGAPQAGDPGEEAEAEGSELGAWPGRRGRCGAGAWACGTRVGQQLPCGRAGRRQLRLQREQRAVSGTGTRVRRRGCRGMPGAGGHLTDLSGGASRRRPCRSHSCSTSGSRSSWSPSCTGSCRRPAWGSPG